MAAVRVFILAGLGGEAEYEQRFREQATALAAAAEKLSGDSSNVLLLSGAKATRDAVRRELQALASRLAADDSLLVVILGHGTFDGEEYRLNLPGPDLTGSELAALFDRLPARDQLIVNATSASGAVIDRWQREGRVVVCATKSGGERTATRFAQYWVQAVTTGAADLNKDEVVTAAEAFDYASRQVAAAYKAELALATEHARLAGEDAGRFAVARLGSAAILSSDPQVNALLSQRSSIERDLNVVKDRKNELSQDEYYDQLESVLVKLVRLQKQIDAQQGAGAGAVQ